MLIVECSCAGIQPSNRPNKLCLKFLLKERVVVNESTLIQYYNYENIVCFLINREASSEMNIHFFNLNIKYLK